jgi:DNA repair photolyase
MNYRSSKELTINLYKGCAHGCVYCYAPSLIHDERKWGRYVDVKVNAPEVLARELRKVKRDTVFISSASDPYQPVEARYRLTRRCLKLLLERDFPVLVLTRSPLVLRDLDLLTKFSWVRVGFSISSVSSSKCEPGVPSLARRIDALKKLHDTGITTWVSLAPVVPQMVLTDFDWLFSELSRAGVSTVTPGALRFIGYEESRKMFEESVGQKSSDLMFGSADVIAKVKELASKHGLDATGSRLCWTPPKNERGLDEYS